VHPLDDHRVLVVVDGMSVIYLPLDRNRRDRDILVGPTFDWADMWTHLTNDERAVPLYRFAEVPLGLGQLRLHVEDALHIVYQHMGTDLSPAAIESEMLKPFDPQHWMDSKQKIRRVGGLSLRRASSVEDSRDRTSSPFVPSNPANTSLGLRSYLTGVHDVPPVAQYPYHPCESSCWLAGRLILLHSYQPGGTVSLRVVDMNPRRSRFVGNGGLGASASSFIVSLQELSRVG